MKKARSARKKVIRGLPILGLDERDYLKEERRLSKQFGHSASPGDIFWGLANRALQNLELNPGQNAHQIQMIHWHMGLYLLEEGRSREEVQGQQRESHRWQLIKRRADWQQVGGISSRRCVIRTDRGTEYACCEACTLLEGARFTYDEFFDQLPLPQANCEKDWCICRWDDQGVDARPRTELADRVSFDSEDPVSTSRGASPGCLSSAVVLVSILLLGIAAVLAVAGF